MFQELANTPADPWMNHLGGNFRCRLQNKSSPSHRGMRHYHYWRFDRLGTIQQEIEVDRARPPMFESLTPQFDFDLLKSGQEGTRRKWRIEQYDAVEKRTLS